MTHAETAMDPVVRILIVEDNPADVNFVHYALEEVKEWPVETSVVDDGEKAISYLQRKGLYRHAALPDLILLDLNLPKYDGIEVLRLIRASTELRSLPVVVLSSSPQDVMRARVGDALLHADCYITKPLDLYEYLAIGPKIRDCFHMVLDSRKVS